MIGTWWVDPAQLDDDQKEVVRLGRDGSFLILGPPGSGKTNLLILRANYLCRADRPNVEVLVFTRTLKEFLVSGAANYTFPTNRVQTYNAWAMRLLSEYGIDYSSENNFEADRKNLLNGLQQLVYQNNKTGIYDCILLDEVHDYTPEEIDIFFELGKNVFAVGDPRQQIYRKRDCIRHLQSKVDKAIPLKYHYRNGINICRLADAIAKDTKHYEAMTNTSNYDETNLPSSVQHLKCKNLEEQCQKVIAAVVTQLEAYPGELIGIICPRREDLNHIEAILESSSIASYCTFQNPEFGYESFDASRRVCVCTLHSAKGLEFRALHILACEMLGHFPKPRNLAFTGVTRAKTSLSLYYAEDLPGFLESALRSLAPREDLPSISEAFGRSE